MKLYREVNKHQESSVLMTIISYGETVYHGLAEPIKITEEEVEVLEELERRTEFMSEHMIIGELLSKLIV